jgi:hypothetical protein
MRTSGRNSAVNWVILAQVLRELPVSVLDGFFLAGRLGRRVGTGSCERGLVVPRHPVGGVRGDGGGVALERDEVVERGDTIQLGGVDQAHEDVADVSAIQGAIKVGVVSVQDGFFQGSFTHVVVCALSKVH